LDEYGSKFAFMDSRFEPLDAWGVAFQGEDRTGGELGQMERLSADSQPRSRTAGEGGVPAQPESFRGTGPIAAEEVVIPNINEVIADLSQGSPARGCRDTRILAHGHTKVLPDSGGLQCPRQSFALQDP
jgi:hypothetical protein